MSLSQKVEHDSDLLLAHGTLLEVVTESGCSYANPNVEGGIDTETKKVKKERRTANKPRARGRKQKAKPSDSLLAELPFANTEKWSDLGFTTPEKGVRKKRKRGDSGRGGSEEDADKKKKRPPRPNYFVSVPITNPQITGGVEAVQDVVVQKDRRLSRALIPASSLHITLLVTHLSSEAEVGTAAHTVAQLKDTLQGLLGGRELVLPFSGIGHFRNEVAFVQLEAGEHVETLKEMAEVVRTALEEQGLPSGDCKALQPHLTFMKLSRAPRLRRQGVKKLDPGLYESFAQHKFGDETVSRLDLCSMLKKKTPDGYYHCEASVALDLVQGPSRAVRTSQTRGAEPNDEELVSLSKRLVEDAVLRAVQQYMEEARQDSSGPTDQGSPSASK